MKTVAVLGVIGVALASLRLLWPAVPAVTGVGTQPPAGVAASMPGQPVPAPEPPSPVRTPVETGAAPSIVQQLGTTALQGETVAERIEAVHALGERPEPEAAGILEQSLDDPAPAVRRAAIDALTVPPRVETEIVLLRALNHPDPAVRELAAETLQQLR